MINSFCIWQNFFSDREIRAVAVFLPAGGLLIGASCSCVPRPIPKQLLWPGWRWKGGPIRLICGRRPQYRGLRRTSAAGPVEARSREPAEVPRCGEDLPYPGGCDALLRHQRFDLPPPGSLYPYRAQICHRAPQYRTGRVVPEPMPPTRFRIDTVGARYLRAIGALSKRQAEAFIRWREPERDLRHGGVARLLCRERFGGCGARTLYYFPERGAAPVDEPVEINTADSRDAAAVWWGSERGRWCRS